MKKKKLLCGPHKWTIRSYHQHRDLTFTHYLFLLRILSEDVAPSNEILFREQHGNSCDWGHHDVVSRPPTTASREKNSSGSGVE